MPDGFELSLSDWVVLALVDEEPRHGFAMAALTGPGRVWLQTLPHNNIENNKQEYLPGPSRETRAGLGAGLVGGVIGSMFDDRG